jgi:streptogramin lyase
MERLFLFVRSACIIQFDASIAVVLLKLTIYSSKESCLVRMAIPEVWLARSLHALFYCGLYALELLLVGCTSGAQSSSHESSSIEAILPNTLEPATSAASLGANILETGSPQVNASPLPKPVPVVLHYVFPSDEATASSDLHRLNSTSKRIIEANSGYSGFTSTAAAISITLKVTPLGGSTTTTTGSCTASASGTSGTCTVSFTAAPGATTLSGSLSELGNVIAVFSQIAIIQPNSANALNFTATPVVSSVALQLSPSTIIAGAATNAVLVVKAMDANGNTIAGNTPYVDVNGNPVTFALNIANAQAGGGGTVSIQGPPAVNAPNQATSVAHYDGKWLANSRITLTSSSNFIANPTPIVLNLQPAVSQEYTVPSANSLQNYIIAGPDGNLWFTEGNTNKIGRVSISGAFTEFSIPTASASPNNMHVGSDGNIWFSEFDANKIGRITMNGNITEYATPTASSNPKGLNIGPDGNIWFTEQGISKIGRITPNGQITEFIIPTAGSQPNDIASGPDGNLWFTEDGGNKIGKMSINGVFTEYNIPTASAFPQAIINGADGNIWFTEGNISKVAKVTLSGSITEYPTPTANAYPFDIKPGPDGNAWFVEYSGNNIAEITTAGVITEYAIPTANSGPSNLIQGPDGNMWFAQELTNQIGEFIL